MIIRTGTTLIGNNTITGMIKTVDLFVGMQIYGVGIPPDTTISSIPSGSSVVMSKNAVGSGTIPLSFSSVCIGTFIEQCQALNDILNVINERGDFVNVILRSESDVARDSYNSIQKRDENKSVVMKAYPIEFRPSQKKLEKAGIREECDIMIYTATKSWNDAGINFNDIEFGGRTTVKYQGNVYEIKDKNQSEQIGDTYLYIILGLFKR